jgi:hypothetical protein
MYAWNMGHSLEKSLEYAFFDNKQKASQKNRTYMRYLIIMRLRAKGEHTI